MQLAMMAKGRQCIILRQKRASPTTMRLTLRVRKGRTVCTIIIRRDRLRSVRQQRKVWVGLVGVMPKPGNSCLEGAKGAYTNAVAIASNADEFKRLVKYALRQMNLFPFEFEDLEPIEARASRVFLKKEIRALAYRASASGQVCFDKFHRFKRLDG